LFDVSLVAIMIQDDVTYSEMTYEIKRKIWRS